MKRALLILGILLLSSVSAVSYASCADATSNGVDFGGRTCQEVSACQSLSSANTYYLLLNDLSSVGSCMRVRASNVVLDLNNNTIYFANFTIDQVYNGDFEIAGATAQLADGWDFSQAPNTVRATGEYYSNQIRSGSYGLVVDPSPGSTDILEATGTFTLEPGLTYLASGYFYNLRCDDDTHFYIDVVRASDDQILARSNYGRANDNTTRGFQFVPLGQDYDGAETPALFSVSSPTEVYIRISILGGPNSDLWDGRVYLDYFRVIGFGNYGVSLEDTRDVLRNGAIVQANDLECLSCDSIVGRFDYGLVENITTWNGGVECSAVDSNLPNTVLKNNHFIHAAYYRDDPGDIVVFRDHMRGIIHAERNPGNLSIHDNIFLGAPQINIYLGNQVQGLRNESLRRIYNNYFAGDTTYSNAFGVETRYLTNTMIYNNTFNYTSGKGVHIDTSQSYNISVFDNWFRTAEQRNDNGLGKGLGYCIQAEGGASVALIKIYNNYCESHTHENYGDAYGMRISHDIADSIIENNTFIAYNDHFGASFNPKASAFSSYAANFINTSVRNNTLKSNHYIYNLYCTTDLIAEDSVLEKIGNNPAFRTVVLDKYSCVTSNNRLVDNIEGIGVDLENVQYDVSTDVGYSVWWTLGVEAYGAGLFPASGASVTVRDSNQQVLDTGSTASDGKSAFTLEEFHDINTVVTRTPQPLNVTVTYGGETQSQTVTLDSPETLQFFFGGKSPDVNFDGKVNIIDLAIVLFNQGRSPANANYAHLDLDSDGDVDFSDAQIVGQFM